MKYVGTFKSIKGETFQVIIITNGSTSQETELTFQDESPVVITQNSSDGLFSPIKSRSCTVTIVSNEPYFDMYSGTSHGTSLVVNNLSKGECIFFGYVTPCEYNQPYQYLNQIEIEAVDAISTLQDFKYSYTSSSEAFNHIASIIKKLVSVAGYTGKILVPQYGCMMKKAWDCDYLPTVLEVLNDDIFYDKGEPISCYEVLEEICNFYGFTCIPYGNDVFFVDYEGVAKYGINYSWLTQGATTSVYGDLKSLSSDFYTINTYSYEVPESISKDDYAGEDQNLEMDDVYNKISVKADIYEVKDDDLGVNPEDEMGSSTYHNIYTTGAVRSDGVNWNISTRYFELINSSYGGWGNNSESWQTWINTNSAFVGFSYRLTDNFSNSENTIVTSRLTFPYTTGYIFNSIVGQCCLPTQQFGYEATKEMPYSTNWNNLLSFFTQGYWIHRYYNDNSISNSYSDMATAWNGDFYNNHFGGTLPVLSYVSPKYINYSPASSSTTSYLCFTGNLFWQRNCSYDDVNYHLWTIQDNYCGGINYPITELGCNSTDNAYSRNSSDSQYNKGWDMLKLKLSIGDKYWNGYYWTTTESTFWIPYHKENVVTDDETLVWTGWNKPVTNHNYTYKVNKDAFVIPITQSDYLYGRLRLSVYMPKIPWDNQIYQIGGNLKVNYEKIPPVIFMKDFGLTLCSTDNSEKWYNVFEGEDDDDVIYANEISSTNVKEMDDLELKINTYNDKIPIAKSYIIEPYITEFQLYSGYEKYHTEGFYNPFTNTTQRQELNIIQKYYSHYSTPKKIYNCVVHGYKAPYKYLLVELK